MHTPVSNAEFEWYVFVDYENVPNVDLDRLEGVPARVILLIGKNQKKLDLALVRQIHRLARQVELIEVGASGRNALDLTLSFHLGAEVERHPQARFAVVSKDKDFDPMIAHAQEGAHVRTGKVSVARYAEFRLLPFLGGAKAPPRMRVAAKAAAQPASGEGDSAFLEKLMSLKPSQRPTTRTRLLRFIGNSFGAKPNEAEKEEILRGLVEANVITINHAGSIRYEEDAGTA